jgi:hypothetical protein
MHLRQSPSWQQIAILPLGDRNRFLETHYKGKDYIGFYLADEKTTLADLKESEIKVKDALKSHLPKYHAELLKTYIFPQLFIA